MPINIASYLKPRSDNTYYLVEDVFIKGGYQVRDTLAARDLIDPLNLKPGMLVMVLEDNKIYRRKEDGSWEELVLGSGSSSSQRQVVEYTSDEIAVNGFKVVEIALGKSVLIHKLSVSTPLKVEAFESPTLTDPNPYTFIPTSDHLEDDGTTLLANGDVVRNRRYSILTNQEEPPSDKIYFRITNNTEIATATTLTIQFVVLE